MPKKNNIAPNQNEKVQFSGGSKNSSYPNESESRFNDRLENLRTDMGRVKDGR